MIYLVSGQGRLDTSNIKLCSISDVLDYFEHRDVVEVDTETESNKRIPKYLPNPFESKVLCLQLGDRLNQFVIDVSTVDIRDLDRIFSNPDKLKIFCNAFFDLRFLIHYGFTIGNVYDVFLAECIIYKGLDLPKDFRSLGKMSERYLGVRLNKEIRGQIHWRGLDNVVIRYAAEDVAHMDDIRVKQIDILGKRNELRYLEFENRFVINLSKMSYRGIKVDPVKWLEVERKNKEKAEKLITVLDREYNKLYPSSSLFKDMSMINWNSYKQVLPILTGMGVDVRKRDRVKGKDVDSVDIKHLKRQSNRFPFLVPYIDYKETQKEISTYGEDFIKNSINPITKRIHSEFFQILETSRISSNSPNLQNIPAADEKGETHPLRKCFVPEDGNVFVIADYSQQEPRISTEYCQDPILLDFVLNGDGDFHSFAATLMSTKLLHKEVKVSKKNNPVVPKFRKAIRDICKTLNLKLDYGGSAYTLKDDLECTQDEAQELIDYLESRTPKKLEYYDKCTRFVNKHGYIVSEDSLNCLTFFHGYHDYKELKCIPYNSKTKQEVKAYYKLKGELERFARNNRIQNTGAIMNKLAHIYFDDEIETLGLEDRAFVAIVEHDSLIVECIGSISDRVKNILENCMTRAGSELCKIVPIKVDLKIAKFWSKE